MVNSITDSMNHESEEKREIVKEEELGVTKTGPDLATEQQCLVRLTVFLCKTEGELAEQKPGGNIFIFQKVISFCYSTKIIIIKPS